MREFLIDVAACLFIHLLPIALFGFRKSFNPESALFREREWERDGRVYRLLKIRQWKDFLPNCGSFDKRHLAGVEPGYLEAFIRETCRGEIIHLSIIAWIPAFALFNPPEATAIIAAYLILENLPCALVQRYNRRRLRALREARSR
jgi:glycosyl-4,4'-diaponeurosporenoate acyltransferase